MHKILIKDWWVSLLFIDCLVSKKLKLKDWSIFQASSCDDHEFCFLDIEIYNLNINPMISKLSPKSEPRWSHKMKIELTIWKYVLTTSIILIRPAQVLKYSCFTSTVTGILPIGFHSTHRFTAQSEEERLTSKTFVHFLRFNSSLLPIH